MNLDIEKLKSWSIFSADIYECTCVGGWKKEEENTKKGRVRYFSHFLLL